jgi:nucleoside recognition membrane protein YjiH
MYNFVEDISHTFYNKSMREVFPLDMECLLIPLIETPGSILHTKNSVPISIYILIFIILTVVKNLEERKKSTETD